MIKIKLTQKQYDELAYVSSLVDGDGKEVNDFIKLEIVLGQRFLALLTSDIDSMIGICDYYISVAKENLSYGEKSSIGTISLYNNVKKKLLVEKEASL